MTSAASVKFLRLTPTELCLEAFSVWCGSFDNSFCGTKDGDPNTIEIFTNNQLIEAQCSPVKGSPGKIHNDFFQLRGSNMKFVSISCRKTSWVSKAHFLINTSQVTALNINKTYSSLRINETSIVNIVNSCPLLLSVCVDGVNISNSSIFELSDHLLHQLTELTLTNTVNIISKATIIFIATHCSNLSKLHMGVVGKNTREDDIVQLLRQNKIEFLDLQNTDFHITNKLLNSLTMLTLGLRHLSLLNCAAVTLVAVGNIIEQCPFLVYLHLSTHRNVKHNSGYLTYRNPANDRRCSDSHSNSSGSSIHSSTNNGDISQPRRAATANRVNRGLFDQHQSDNVGGSISSTDWMTSNKRQIIMHSFVTGGCNSTGSSIGSDNNACNGSRRTSNSSYNTAKNSHSNRNSYNKFKDDSHDADRLNSAAESTSDLNSQHHSADDDDQSLFSFFSLVVDFQSIVLLDMMPHITDNVLLLIAEKNLNLEVLKFIDCDQCVAEHEVRAIFASLENCNPIVRRLKTDGS